MHESDNQQPQLSFDQIIQSLPIPQEVFPFFVHNINFIERIADQLNQSPKRKSSLGFSVAWFLGIKGVFGINAALFLALPIVILAEPSEEGLDPIGYLILLFLFALGLLGLYLVYISFRTLRMLKNGYYTLGLQIENGVFVYKDESGVTRQWTSKWHTRLLQQPCPDFNNSTLNLIAVDRNNPDRILIVDFEDYCESKPEAKLSFNIPAWFIFFPLPVKFDLSSRTFSTTWSYYLKLLAVIIVVVIFVSILDYFNL